MGIIDNLCMERHKRIDEKLDNHEYRLNNYGKRLDMQEQKTSAFEATMSNLISQLSDLTSTMKWFLGIWLSTLLGFFIYIIQNRVV